MTDKQEYDRYAKSLWVKVYQDLITKEGCITAKNMADIAVEDYMQSIHGQKEKEATLKDLHETKYNGKPLELLIDGKPVSEILKDSVVKKNFTTESSVQNLHNGTFVEVPFRVNEFGAVVMQRQSSQYDLMTVCGYCKDNNIDQTRIKHIWLEMKSEDD